jgi:hypothetical protein
MDIVLAIIGASTIGCAAALAAHDYILARFSMEPSSMWAFAVKALSILSTLVSIGFYVCWFALAIELLLFIDVSRFAPRLNSRVVVVPALFATYFLVFSARSSITKLARSAALKKLRSSPACELPTELAHNSGGSLPWFPAMQYYALMLNRTYKVFIADGMLCGAVVRGLVASPPETTTEMNEAEYWVNTLAATLYERLDVTSKTFLTMSMTNFQIAGADISRVDYDPSPKWGMGNVSHSGKIKVRLKNGKTRELVLLGQQNGDELRAKICEAVGVAQKTSPSAA